MFTQIDLNLRQRKWLELVKDYDLSVFYHPRKANVFANALSRTSIGSVIHVVYDKKELVKEVHKLSQLGIRLEYYAKEGFMVQHNLESSLVVEVKSRQHLDPLLMELNKSVHTKYNESFSQG